MSHEHLHQLLEGARELLHRYGYAGLFALICAENFGLPLPGETIFIAAILASAKGEMNIVPVVVCAWTGSVLGGTIGFAIGRWSGHRLLEKYGRYIGINAVRLAKIEEFSRKYGAVFVVLGRFFEGVRQIYAILAGCVQPSWRRFSIANVAGATLWVGFWTLLVLWLGRLELHHVWDRFKEHEVAIFLGVAIIAAISAASLHLWRRRVSSLPQ